MKARFGLGGAPSRTLEEVGRDFRLTRERVRQIEARALHKLRQPYRNYRVRDFKLDQMLVQAGVLGHPSGTINAAKVAVAEAEAAAKRNEVALARRRLGTVAMGSALGGATVGMGGGIGGGYGGGGGYTTGIASELQSFLGARSKEKEEAARLLREGGEGENGLEGLPRHEPLLDVGLGGGGAGGLVAGPASELLRKQQEQLQVEEEEGEEEEDEDDTFEFEDEFATALEDKFDDDFEDDFEDDLAAAVFGSDGSRGGSLKSTATGQGGASMDAVRTLNKAWTNTANSVPIEAADQLSIMGVSVAPRSPDEEQEQLLSTLDSFDLLDETSDEEEGSTTTENNAMDRLQSEMKVTPMSLGERTGAVAAGERAAAVAATSRSLQAA